MFRYMSGARGTRTTSTIVREAWKEDACAVKDEGGALAIVVAVASGWAGTPSLEG